MPKKRPRPRLGLQGASQAEVAYTRTITSPAAAAIIRLSGCLGRNAPLEAMTASRESRSHTVQVLERDPDRRAMGAHLDAGRALRPRQAQVALGRDLDRLAVRPLLFLLDHRDVAPRAAVGAVAAPDAGGRVDGHFQRADLAGDGTGRAIDHADGVRALVARRGDEPPVVAVALAYEARLPAMRVRAAAHALVAARARGEVDEQHALTVNEAGLHRHLHVFGRGRLALDGPARLEARHRFHPQRVLDVRIGGRDLAEHLARELDHLDVLEGLEGEGPGVVEEEGRLSRVVALAQVGQGEVGRARPHRDLDVASDDQQERFRGRALLDDHLAGFE